MTRPQIHLALGQTRVLILGTGDLALGLALLLGGPLRTSSPSFTVIKTYAPIPIWGALIAFIGTFLLIGLRWHQTMNPIRHARIENAFATAGSMWGAFWFVALLQAAVHDDHVALTGPVTYSFFFTLPHLALAFGREG